MKCPYCLKEFSAKDAKIRSTPENKYMWGVVVEILSNELGYSKNEMHEILKGLFLREPRHIKAKDKVKEVWITKSTTELTVAEFEDYMSEIRQWASIEMGIFIPEPNEVSYILN